MVLVTQRIGVAVMSAVLAALITVGCGRETATTAKPREAQAITTPAAETAAGIATATGTARASVLAANGAGTAAGRKTSRSAAAAAREKVLDVDRQELNGIRTIAGLGGYLATGGDQALAAEKLRQFAAQGDAVIPELKTLLADPAPEVARLGAEGLAIIGTPAALQELVDYLQALPPNAEEQRRELASVLAEQARNAESVPYWNALLEKADLADDVRDAAISALAHSLTTADLKELGGRYAATQDEAARQTYADVVRQVEGPEYVPQLLALAGNPTAVTAPDPLTLAAWDTVAAIGTPQGVTQLLTWVDQVNGDAATAMAHAIGMVRNPASLAILQQAAATGSPRQQAAAAGALKNFTGNWQ